MIDPLYHLLSGIAPDALSGYQSPEGFQPPSESDIAAMLGPEPSFQPQQFRASPYQQILESLAYGVASAPPFRPRNFGEGLASGFVHGLGGAGARVAAAREKFAADQAKRQAETDAERMKYRQNRFDVIKQAYQDYARNKEANRTVTEADVAANPSLAPYLGQPVPASVLYRATVPSAEKPTATNGVPVDETLAKRFPQLSRFKGQTIPAETFNAYTKSTPGESAAATASAGFVPLDPATRAMIGRLVLMTGDPRVAVLGRGKEATAQAAAILNDVAKQNPDADLAFNKAGYGADRASLQKAQTVLDGLMSFKRGTQANMGNLRQLVTEIPDLGLTPLNAVARDFATKLGSRKMARFSVFQKSVSTEAARIINNANIYLDLGEQSRKDLDALKGGTLTVGQTLDALDALNTEFANRAEGQQQTIDLINERIKQRNPNAKDETGGGATVSEDQAKAEYERLFGKGKK